MRLQNRNEAGSLLALKLKKYHQHPNGLVLGLPRGGVPVAYKIAKSLKLPLDICLVRKLGVPGKSELAMGAIALGNIRVFNENIINSLNISSDAIEKVIEKEQIELARREKIYRGNRPFPIIKNRILILVDDGIATGATLKAAIMILKQQQPDKIIVAVPIIPSQIIAEIKLQIDSLVYLIKPHNLQSISLWYDDFRQTSDEEVCQLLN